MPVDNKKDQNIVLANLRVSANLLEMNWLIPLIISDYNFFYLNLPKTFLYNISGLAKSHEKVTQVAFISMNYEFKYNMCLINR